jgi:hypothetical protein
LNISLDSLRRQHRGHMVEGVDGLWFGGVRTRAVALRLESAGKAWQGMRRAVESPIGKALDGWAAGGLPAYVIVYFGSGQWYLLPWSWARRAGRTEESEIAEFAVGWDWWEEV